ncbi:2-oxoglutarate dehydrogenase, E2 component, dihydrolipoamide succinyltransferase [Ornithinimicrobium sp. CNJ-824]|uniref:2-oxoglutarate dehydrogenase, E2 component, dihydrolipoamide succinyltransferase n=1 Tax=Ornithinimicrobium sp. CNJ-824 TaxID=1904966 RepID=UPI0009630B5C|nr:2-oxoglutarate dehydrogenase, E2 component, dihydrolipoamide succinyltransferase [Ornithinimicrobium sp. CNJ-824]OLT20020.1 2-oxoglutarate dehydrogenase, E2 component, dihydrolipoamide succinyltransferase [Ornithinimicrobium sp. CNJ-824]
MSERVSMPALGESVTEGTVTRWLKEVGDSVAVDEPLLEVSTDKVDTEIPSPVAGVLLEILAQEDDTVEVGGDLAVVGEEGESAGSGGSSDDAQAEEADEPEQEEAPAEEPAQEPAEEPAEEPEPEASSDDGGDSGQASGGSGGGGGGETVTMPALGESVTEGTVTRWLKAEGDTVEVDEPLLEVSTDKVDTEIPSPVAGVLSKILAQEDETVEVGGELCVVGGGASGGSSDDGGQASSQQTEESTEDEGASDAADNEEDREEAAESADSDLAEEAEVQDEAAEESQSKSETGEANDDAAKMEEPEPAVGVGVSSSESGTSSHKDVSDVPAPGDGGKDEEKAQPQQDVSAYVTPLVRKLAAQHGVDLNSLEGTGVGGRIRKQDVLDAAKAKEAEKAAPAKEAEQAAPAEESKPAEKPAAKAAPSGGSDAKRGTTEKMSRLRKVIATRMVESLQGSAQLTTVVEVDVTKISRLRRRTKEEFLRREGTKLSYLPFFALAAVEALKEHPIVNSSVEDDSIVYHASEHLGVAVDTPRGLLVPVIKDAGDLNIAGLARKIADLAERTRDNKVTPDELSGGTFTLTNTGSRGALFDTPIINQPNVAILGTGAVVKRPVVVVDEDGMETIAIRDMVFLALSYDHRVVDGADAARFLNTMKERLEDASFEV